MSVESMMTQRVDILRRREGEDRLGQPTSNFKAFLSGQPCRLTTGSGSEQMTERSRGVVVEDFKMFLRKGTSIREDDRVTIYDRTGETLVEAADVTLVKRPSGRDGTEHHVEVSLKLFRGGSA